MNFQAPSEGRLRLHPTSEEPVGPPTSTIATVIEAQDALLARLAEIEARVGRMACVLDGTGPACAGGDSAATDAIGFIDAAMLRLSDMAAACARIEAHIERADARLR